MSFAKDQQVIIKGFIEGRCDGCEPMSGTWQHDVYMAEKTNEVCKINAVASGRDSVSVRIPSIRESWWVKSAYVHPYNSIEQEAEQL